MQTKGTLHTAPVFFILPARKRMVATLLTRFLSAKEGILAGEGQGGVQAHSSNLPNP